MALKKTNPSNSTAAAAEFEQEPGSDATATTAEVSTTQAEAAVAPADTVAARTPETEADADASAKVTATTAIAKASSTSTAVAVEGAASQAKQFQKEVEAMKGAGDFSFGNYRVFKGTNGALEEVGGDEATLGRWAKVRMLAWDDHFEISPGDKGASTKDFVAYSKDGQVVDSVIGEEQKPWVGRKVSDYVEYLKKEEEFDKASVRRFIDISCALLAADDTDGPVGEIIQVSLAPSSIPAFSKYQEDLKNKARCVAMGLPGFAIPEDPFTFFFLRESASKGDEKWTKLKILSNLPAKI